MIDAEVLPPPPPAPKPCPGACSGLIYPAWVEPVKFMDRTLEKTGCWAFQEACDGCLANQAAQRDLQGVRDMLKKSGLAGKLARATLDTCRDLPSDKVRQAVTKTALGHANLYLFGGPGRGKTWLAAALLRHDIEARRRQGYFENVPDLMAELREAAGKGSDNILIMKLTHAGALVLDDMGVERPTHYALETLYRLIDRWDRQEKKGLIITSNKPLSKIADELDDRLASRIGGMCEVIELTGVDRRLPA